MLNPRRKGFVSWIPWSPHRKATAPGPCVVVEHSGNVPGVSCSGGDNKRPLRVATVHLFPPLGDLRLLISNWMSLPVSSHLLHT